MADRVDAGRPKSRAGRPGARPQPHGTATKRLYGLHPVAQAWQNPVRTIHRLSATPAGLEALQPALARAASLGLARPDAVVLDRAGLEALLPPGAVHQGVALDCAPLPTPSLEQLLPRLSERACLLVLDQVTDPHNAGAILRSAAAFSAEAVLVPDRHAPEVTGALAKSAAGAVELVPMVRVANLVRALAQLKTAGFWIVGLTEQAQQSLAEGIAFDRLAFVLGAEGAGLRRLTAEHCDLLVSLPTGGPLASLNVSNAAAIALYERARAPRPGMSEDLSAPG